MSLLIAKYFRGIDIREHGSGNVGATNVYRTAGKITGAAALLLDAGKGIFAVTVIAKIFIGAANIDHETFVYILGLAVIVGHIWSVFLKFKGGKGIATSTGVLLIIAPKIIFLSFLVWIAVFAIMRYVSFASIISALSFPIFSYFYGTEKLTIFGAILCLITVLKHKSNIERLISGNEHKFKKHKIVKK
jgi:glycerol-3-phosphate acyltransferase PlsY